jgi:Protein of unknown function (DUF664)
VGIVGAFGPPAAGDEAATLLGGLERQRACFAWNTMLLGQDLVAPWDAVNWQADADWPWRSAARDSPAELYALWGDAVGRSRASVARAMTRSGLDGRIRYRPGGGPQDALSLRRLLVDLIEEYARHVGHADLIRETIDGLVGEDPPGPVYPYQPPAALAAYVPRSG